MASMATGRPLREKRFVLRLYSELSRAIDERRDERGGAFLESRDRVRVRVHRHRDVRMPQRLLHHLGLDAGAQGVGGMAVP